MADGSDILTRVGPGSLLLKGGKSGGGGGMKEDPNNLQSTSNAIIIDLLSEGEIGGLIDGAKSIFLDDTPLQNGDDSYNFQGVVWDQRTGTPDQEPIKGFSDVEGDVQVGVEVKQAVPISRTVNGLFTDAVRVTVGWPSLEFVDQDNSRIMGTEVEYMIELYDQTTGVLAWQNSYSVTGKTNSEYQRQHYIQIPERVPYTLRVTRKTADATTQDYQNTMNWVSYTEIVEVLVSYSDSAIIGMQIDAKQFGTSIPARAFEVSGIKCRVPVNYNPVTHTYSGEWDGMSWKRASTNDPAWILNDVLTNDRYGLGEEITQDDVDVWSLYAVSLYSNQSVPDGYGGHEPRFTFDGTIATQAEAYEAITILTSAFRGMSYWGAGKTTVVQDSPEDPIIDVNDTNALDGSFGYERTSKFARATVVYVTWNDPMDSYRPAVEVVQDSEGLARYGWRRRDITLPGCKSRAMANRMGRWLLYTELMEKETIKYRCYADHLRVRVGSIVRVSDPKRLAFRGGGRLQEVINGTHYRLDAPVAFSTGLTYRMAVIQTDGTPEEINIVNPGNVTTDLVTLVHAPSMAQIPGYTWTILSSDLAATLYRVLLISEVTEDDGITLFEVSGMIHNPEKFDYIERDIPFSDKPTTRLPPPNKVPPIGPLLVKINTEVSATGVHRIVDLSWTAPDDPYVTGYQVRADAAGSGMLVIGSTTTPSLRLMDPVAGEWKLQVLATNPWGYFSAPRQATFTLSPMPSSLPPPITGLELVRGATPNEFVGRNVRFRWRAASSNVTTRITSKRGADRGFTDLLFKDYLVTVRKLDGTILRQFPTQQLAFTYHYEMNFDDTGGVPVRDFYVEVAYRGKDGSVGKPARLIVTNRVPALPNFTFDIRPNQLAISYDHPSDTDFAGMQVWMSTSPGVATTNGNRVWNGPGNIRIPITANGTYYFKISPFDVFGKDNTVVSNEYTLSSGGVSGNDLDQTPPDVPTGVAVSQGTDTDDDGKVITVLNVDWTDLSMGLAQNIDFAAYEVRVKLGAQVVANLSVVDSEAQVTVRSNKTYAVQVRSRDRLGNVSAYATTVNITTIKKSAGPAAPTSPTAADGIKQCSIGWVQSVDSDVNQYRIRRGSTSGTISAAFAASIVVGSTQGAQFIDTVVTLGSAYRYWVCAVNTSLVESSYVFAGSAVARGIKGDQDYDTTPCDVPSGLALSQTTSLDADGKVITKIIADWNDLNTAVDPNKDFDRYAIIYQEAGGTQVNAHCVPSEYAFTAKVGVAYTVKVLSIDLTGNKSAWTSTASLTPVKKSAAPNPPSGVSASVRSNQIILQATLPADTDIAALRTRRNTTNAFGTATLLNDVKGTAYVDQLPVSGASYYYFLSLVDTSNNESSAVTVGPVTARGLQASDIDTGAIDLAGVKVTGVVPTVGIATISTRKPPSAYK